MIEKIEKRIVIRNRDNEEINSIDRGEINNQMEQNTIEIIKIRMKINRNS